MRRTLLLIAGAALLAAVKLWLVLGDEIVARPADAWYLASAARFYWGGSFADDAFLGLPGYPLWLALVDRTGVPLRIAIELLLIAAALTFAWCVIRLGHGVWAGLLIFAAIIFHPVSFDINNYAHPDTLYAPLALFAISLLMLQYVSRDARAGLPYGVAAGALLAMMWLTRPEASLLWAWLFIFALMVLLANLRRGRALMPALQQAALVAAIPFAVASGVTLLVRALNYQQFGVFATSERTAPGFRAMNRALLSIAPVQPGLFEPVPRETRQRAYAVSPLFHRLEPHIEGPAGDIWRHAGTATGTTDIAGAWLPLALRDAVRRAGHARTAGEAEAFYRQVAAGLRTACRDGRLECRTALHPYVPPDFTAAGQRLTSSFAVLGSKFFWAWAPARERDDPVDGEELARLFNETANRRRHLAARPLASVSGWAFSIADPLAALTIRDREGRVRAATYTFMDRPDVTTHFAARGNVPREAGFSIDFPLLAPGELNVEFVTRAGRTFDMPISGLLQRNRQTNLAGTGGSSLSFNIEQVTISGSASARRPLADIATSLENRIWTGYGVALLGLSVAGILGLLLTLVFGRAPALPGVPTVALPVFLAVAILLRLAMATIIDAFAWPVDGYRYMYAAMILYSALLILLISQGVRTWRAQYEMMQSPDQPRERLLIDRTGALIRP
ncbi:hypothetical protein BH23GEM9_BH23GEM9_23460 [soil metagenome]